MVDVEPDTPLLWVLRDTITLTGTKFGCGIEACGVCTVHLDGRAVRTCTLPVSAAEGMQIELQVSVSFRPVLSPKLSTFTPSLSSSAT